MLLRCALMVRLYAAAAMFTRWSVLLYFFAARHSDMPRLNMPRSSAMMVMSMSPRCARGALAV